MTSSNSTDLPNKYQSNTYRTYVLCVLTLVYALNFVDRQLLAILQESIKAELLLSDTQLGLLTGFAFALFYVLAGVPIARLADRSSRRNVIAISIAVWSFMTAISGLVVNYTQLLLARMGVGVGEAGCSPPAHSMISDMYPEESRATALSFYSIGINIGIMLGFILGGWINQVFGWRTAFIVVGAPGLLVALYVRLTVAEPIRGWSENKVVEHNSVPFMDVLRLIAKQRFLLHLCFAAGLSGFVGYALTNWMASFFIRSFNMPTGELGVWLACGVGILGSIGTFGWGYLCDRFGQQDKRYYMWLPALAIFLAIIPIVLGFTSNNKTVALITLLFPAMFTTGYLGAVLALFHGAVEVGMRATTSALFFLALNIIGLGFGPTVVGAVSDVLSGQYGNESLRYAILFILPALCMWSAVHFLLAARAFTRQTQAQS